MGCDNVTNATEGGVASSLTKASLVVLVVLFILLTVSGNVLVVIAVFTSRALKAPQNLFLVSLASADILVATLVMPFSLANELMGYWYFGPVWCEIYLALDVLFCTASIAHLCAISLDRYWSITRAVEYNLKRTPRRIKCVILVVWVIAAVISFPPLTIKKEDECQDHESQCAINDDKWYIISSSIGSFFLPCIIMVLVYIRIYQIAKSRTRTPPGDRRKRDDDKKENGHCHEKLNGDAADGNDKDNKGDVNAVDMEESSSSDHKVTNPCASKKKRSKGKTKLSQIKPGDDANRGAKNSRWKGKQNREKRFTFVLAVVIGVFMVCWFPFFFSYTLIALCGSSCVPPTLFKFFFWFGYCNSSLNPIIYTIFNNDFRRAFKKILCRRDSRRVA